MKQKKTHHIVMCLTVQEKRLELSWYCYHTDLNRTRLPIPPFLHLLTAAFENHALSTKNMLSQRIEECKLFLKKMTNFLIFLFTVKKNVPWHILAPRRGCFSNHLPLRRVRILAERFSFIGRIFLWKNKKAHHNVMCFTVQEKRLELSWYCYHTDLNRTRLPIPPFLHCLLAADKMKY